ncbi:MAG: Hsp20 family protein [Candidatus Hydrogenedens sp.]|nr:Hsp20 family protein [Candidatus Hydrogenedens sp.]
MSLSLKESLKDLVPHWWGKREVPVTGSESEDPVQSLHREINRAFADFWRSFDAPPFGAGFATAFGGLQPRADVVETDKQIEVSVELPGLEEKDVEVSVSSGLLTVKAEKKSEKEDKKAGWHLSERSYGLVQRAISLPAGADTDHAAAKFRNGVLTVTIPKTATAAGEVKKIAVRQA